MRDPRREHRTAGPVPNVALLGGRNQLIKLVRRNPPPPRTTHDHDPVRQRLRRGAKPRPDRGVQHLRHPRITLDHPRLRRILRRDLHPGHQVIDRRLPDLDLPQRRQHLLDVLQELLVRPDDQRPAPPQPIPVRIEQERDTVQPDRRLPGPRSPLHTDTHVHISPNDLVLLRLDRRHDVAHRPRPRPLDLIGQNPTRPSQPGRNNIASTSTGTGTNASPRRRPRIGQRLIFVPCNSPVREPEPPPPVQPHRHLRRGPVESRRHRRTPVDDHRLPGPVVHMTASDVVALGPELTGLKTVAVVEATEEQRDVRIVPQRLRPRTQRGKKVLRRDGVAALGPQGQSLLAHRLERSAGLVEMGLLGAHNGVGDVTVFGHGGLLKK